MASRIDTKGLSKDFYDIKSRIFHWTARKVMRVPSGFENVRRCSQVIIH